MCFSTTASFTAASVLIPVGIFAGIYAFKFKPTYLLLALIPLLFGIQQLFEGLVWYHLLRDQKYWVYVFGRCYLFFAYALWPSFFACAIGVAEPNPRKKRLLMYAAVAGILLGFLMYGPILNRQALAIYQLHHSICYDSFFSFSKILGFNFFYLGITLFSCVLASDRLIKLLGLVILISYFLAGFWYLQTFTSVWCFFVALLSIFIVFVVVASPDQLNPKKT